MNVPHQYLSMRTKYNKKSIQFSTKAATHTEASDRPTPAAVGNLLSQNKLFCVNVC